MEETKFSVLLTCPGKYKEKNVKFYNPEIRDKCEEAICNAECNLLGRHRLRIYDWEAIEYGLILYCTIPKEKASEVSTRWFRGISMYLLKTYSDTFVPLKRGIGLFNIYLLHSELEDQNATN